MAAKVYRILSALVVFSLLGAVACATAATPTPTVAKPAATVAAPAPTAAKPAPTATSAPAPAKPTEAPSAAKPAAPAAAKVAPAANWEATWKSTLEAAKKEGKVVVAGGPGTNRRDAALAFQKAYPDIKIEFTGITGPAFASRAIPERQGGQFLWDVVMSGATTVNSSMRPAGLIAPLRPAIILPEILDDSKWIGGFNDGWADKEGSYVYQFLAYLMPSFYVNRDQVTEAELSKIDQLLDPKWKGKISTTDPRIPGPAGTSVGFLLYVKGEEWLRKLYSHDLVLMKDGRTQADALVRGRLPVAYGLAPTELLPFLGEGLGKNVKVLEPDGEIGYRVTGGFGYIALVDRAPNPNAAKVFINWALSQAGQKAFLEYMADNSRRNDVPVQPQFALKPGKKYENIEKEGPHQYMLRANAIAKEIIK